MGLIWLKFPFASRVKEGFGIGVVVWSRVAEGWEFSIIYGVC